MLPHFKSKKLPGFYQTLIPYPLIVSGLPMLVASPSDGTLVKGEVWEVTDRCLSILDRIEGHPRLYRRAELVVTPIDDTDQQSTVFAYLFPQSNLFARLSSFRCLSWWTGIGQPEPK